MRKIVIAGAALLSSWLPGCQDPGCIRNSECPKNYECRKSRCVSKAADAGAAGAHVSNALDAAPWPVPDAAPPAPELIDASTIDPAIDATLAGGAR